MPQPGDREPCSLARLMLVMLYDGVIMVGILILAAALASPFDQGNQQAGRDPLFTAYLVAAWFAYLVVCWRRAGMTVGMRAWKVRISGTGGHPPGWRACFIRFGASLLSALALGAGFWAMLFDVERRSWHDRLSETRLYLDAGSH